MSTFITTSAGRADRLTRSDVERLLKQAGSSDRLNLSGQDLSDIDLSFFNLTRTDLSKAILFSANLTGAKLNGAKLNGAKLNGAKLNGAQLFKASLDKADLRETTLVEANLVEATLTGATLFDTDLQKADLSRADLFRATLRGARLNEANLSEANLSEANLSEADLRGAKLTRVKLNNAILGGALISPASVKDILFGLKVMGVEELNAVVAEETRDIKSFNSSSIEIQINEEPLTAQNLTKIISTFIELYTKYWLIQQGRFKDFFEYTQTHDERYEKEANLLISKLTYNSPAKIKFNLDFSPQSVVKAFKIAIDTILGAPHRAKAMELNNQAKELDNQAKKLDNQVKELDFNKKRIEYALELAERTIDELHPGLDEITKANLKKGLLSTLLQLESFNGLEVILSVSQINTKSEQEPLQISSTTSKQLKSS